MSQYGSTFDLKINVGHCDLYFMVKWFCHIFPRLFDGWVSHFQIMRQCDPNFYLIIHVNIGQHDLYFIIYFMVVWFCLIVQDYLMDEHHSWYNGSVWYRDWPHQVYVGQWPIFYGPVILLFQIMRQCDPNFYLIIHVNIGQHDLYFIIYFMVVWFCLIVQDYLMDEHHSWYNGSVWYRDWPHQVYVGQWPIFYGPVILLFIWKTIWWRNIVFEIMDQCDPKIDHVKYMWVSGLYFMVHWFCLISCHTLKLFLYSKNWCQPGVFMPLWALALVCLSNIYRVIRPWSHTDIELRHIMRKPVYAVCEQRHGSTCVFVIRCLSSIVPKIALSAIQRLLLASTAEHADFSLTWSQTLKTGILSPAW